MNTQRTLNKTVEVSKIVANESKSDRKDEQFRIVKTNKKLRKTIAYYSKKKTNNVLDPKILLREDRNEDDCTFTCLEGEARIFAIKRNKRVKYLKCRVQGAIKGVNEIKRINNEFIEVKRPSTITIRFDDCPAEIKAEFGKKPTMKRTRVPTMGKIA